MLPQDAITLYLNGTGIIFEAQEGDTILGAGINMLDAYADCVDAFYITNEDNTRTYIATPYTRDSTSETPTVTAYSGSIVDVLPSDSEISLEQNGSFGCSASPQGWVTYIPRPLSSGYGLDLYFGFLIFALITFFLTWLFRTKRSS